MAAIFLPESKIWSRRPGRCCIICSMASSRAVGEDSDKARPVLDFHVTQALRSKASTSSIRR